MGIVDRIKTGRHVKTLKNAERASPAALAEAKTALVESGLPVVGPVVEALALPAAQPHAREVLAGILDEDSLSAFVEAMATADRRVQAGISEVLRAGRSYDPMGLLPYLSRPDVPRARLEAVLMARAADLRPRDLLAVMPDYEREARSIVFRIIEKTCDPSFAPDVASLVVHKDWWVRAHAARLLARMPGEIAEEALSRLLGDPNKSVRMQAVVSLEALGARSAIPQLVKVLKDPDLKVQAAAIDALVKIDDPSAVPHLVDVLKDESEQTRRGAVEVLNEVATVEAVHDLVHSLRDADWWVRVRSADALGTIGGEKVVDAILALMDDEDVHIRRYAVEILNTVPDGRSVESLVKALEDEDWWVRERSIDALGRTGDQRAVEPLVRILSLRDQTGPLCARALAALGSTDAIPALLPFLSGDPGDEMTREAVQAIAKIANSGSIDDEVHLQVEEALRAHGVRLEKTRLRPMEVRTEKVSPDISLEVASPSTDAPYPADRPSLAGNPAGSGGNDVRPDEVEPGTVFHDRYTVIRKIGSGGFSTVFLVEDRAISERVILKILSPHLSMDENIHLRFVQELKVARRISHPNVIRIHDLLEIGRSRAISMEYFEGADLGDILQKEKTLDPSRGLALVRQICEGLAAAHEAGVIHRDVKPANILVAENDDVKLVDFGLAAVQREAENRLTRTGHLVGTPHYMPPELIRGEEVDPRSDLYSLGVVMYEMFTGALPYSGDNPMNVLFKHLDGNAPPPREVREEIPAALSDLVMRVMAREREDRPTNAAELKRQIEELGI